MSPRSVSSSSQPPAPASASSSARAEGVVAATTVRDRVASVERAIGHLLTAAAAALLGGVGLASPAAAQVSVAPGVTAGRVGAAVAAVVGLISVVIGGLALRSQGRTGTGNGRSRAIMALVVGLIGIVLGGQHLARHTGGFGTGDGRAGAIVALVVGLVGMVLGGLALARSRRTA